jgi:hypothetical protein
MLLRGQPQNQGLDMPAIPNAISIVQDENQLAGAERLG